MAENSRFMIVMQNSFYAFELYNEKGDYVYSLEEAKEEANRQYGETWKELYNGNEGVMKDEV